MVELYPSQKEILAETEGNTHAPLILGCGAGKTFIGSEKLIEYNTPWNLIVCQRSQVPYWCKHFETHYPHLTVTDLTKVKELSLANLRPGVLVINYDLVFRRQALLDLKHFTLMLDESSLIQNSQAKRTKFIEKLKPDHVILLSGTPVSGAVIDRDEGIIFGRFENLLSQCHLLGWKISKSAFWDRYVMSELRQYGDIRVKEVVGYKNIPELNQKLRELGFVFRRTEDIVDLPDYDDQVMNVPVIPEYKRMMKHGIVEIEDDELVGDIPLTKLLRLRQLCGGYNHNKESVLKDLLETLENERVVIFYNFIRDRERILPLLEGRPVFRFDGDVKDFDEDEFKSPENHNAVVLAQYSSGSRGHNMQAARYIIYYDPTDRAEFFDQSRGRIRREGQKADRVMYYHLICEKSVEEKILTKVRAGLDYDVEDYIAEYE